MKISIPHPVNTHKLAWPRVSLLDRYIIQELIPTFLFGIGLFTSIALTVDTVFDLVRQVAESGLDIGVALRVFLLRMPEFIVLAFPMSMVLATLMVYSRLSSDSELVALRSCGVSLYRLVVPTLILSLLVTALTFAFNELIVPATNYQATMTLERALNRDRLPFQEDNIFYPEYDKVEIPGSDDEMTVLSRLFYAEQFDGRQMQGVTILDRSQTGITQIISSRSATWNGAENVWDFFDGTLYAVDAEGSYRNILRFDHKAIQLSRTPLDLATKKRGYDEMNIVQAQDYLKLMKLSGDERRVQKTRVRIQQKYALPFVCIVFGLLGASLGARPQRASKATSFGISIIVIFSYYLLSFVTGAIGQKAILTPFISAWLPNFLGLGVAGLLLWRASR
ncbi:MAG: YjgP/YjgQ family permease [Oscillatoriales cyanobacterium RM2_1_1]|nr:YjgP/YjgQ family permease [Oscillatoriales cyanobacterium SM2_3_0]NJO46697.1 YjgP/YjgQ family permease [Oscillatoriales cyanobacterium RM2_1_1]